MQHTQECIGAGCAACMRVLALPAAVLPPRRPLVSCIVLLFLSSWRQALEPACWAALLKGRKAVLAGDHLQVGWGRGGGVLRFGLGRLRAAAGGELAQHQPAGQGAAAGCWPARLVRLPAAGCGGVSLPTQACASLPTTQPSLPAPCVPASAPTCQLPPTVISEKAARAGLTRTLFERLQVRRRRRRRPEPAHALLATPLGSSRCVVARACCA